MSTFSRWPFQIYHNQIFLLTYHKVCLCVSVGVPAAAAGAGARAVAAPAGP